MHKFINFIRTLLLYCFIGVMIGFTMGVASGVGKALINDKTLTGFCEGYLGY